MKPNSASFNNSLLFNNKYNLPYEQCSSRIDNVDISISAIYEFQHPDIKQSRSNILKNTNEIKISDIDVVSSCSKSSIDTTLELDALSKIRFEDKLLKGKLYSMSSNYTSDPLIKQLHTRDVKFIHVIDSIFNDSKAYNLDINKISYDINKEIKIFLEVMNAKKQRKKNFN